MYRGGSYAPDVADAQIIRRDHGNDASYRSPEIDFRIVRDFGGDRYRASSL